MDAMQTPTVTPARGEATSRRSPVHVVVALLLLLATFATLLRQATRPLYDPDLWWHLRSGQLLLGDWSIRDPGTLSRFATQPWFSPSWLPEIAFAQAEQWFGLPAIAWLYGASMLALVATVYIVTRRHAGILAASVVTFVAVAGASGALTPRPHVIGFIFLAATSGAWMQAIRNLRPPWWLIPLTWVWAMSHGMWLVGVMLGVGTIVGLALDRRLDLPVAFRQAAVPLGSVAVAMLTPIGPRILTPVTRIAGWQGYITEYAPPTLTDPQFLLTLGLVGVVALGALRSTTRMPWANLALAAQATIWTLYSLRSIPWGAMIIAPLAAQTLQSWLPRRDRLRVTRHEVAAIGITAVVGLGVLALAVPSTTRPGRVPDELSGELAALPAGTAILNDYALGGWIEWRHRGLHPVIDGNTFQYRLSDMEAYDNATKVGPGWDEYVTDKGVTHAVLEPDSPLAHALQQRLDWSVTATGEDFVLIAAPGSE